MPALTIYPRQHRFLNIGKESVAGTPVAGTATIPVTRLEPEDKPDWLLDQALRFAMAGEYGLTIGPEVAALGLGGPVYADTIGHLLLNILGDQAVSGAGPFTHTFALLNSGTGQPATHTLIDTTGIPATSGARQYAYSCLTQLTITGAATGLLVWSATVASYVSTIPGSPPATHLSTVSASASWNSAVSIGGSAVADVASWEIQINRVVDPFWSVSGATDPPSVWRGECTVAGTLTFAPAVSEAPLTTMLANTQPTVTVVATAPSSASLTLRCTQAAYDTSKISDASPLLGYGVTFRGIANSTDVGGSGGYSPIKATLINSVSGTY